MDKLHSSQKQEVEAINYRHTLKVLNNQISVVFYDVTTLYFEIDNEDELRKTGFSKEGKHQNHFWHNLLRNNWHNKPGMSGTT
jgi:hypothetical protein